MADSNRLLPAIDAQAMAAVLQIGRLRWNWDERHASYINGSLLRGNATIQPLRPEAAAIIVSMCREGWGLRQALKKARITQRQFFAWVAKSHTPDADAEPYRRFREELIVAFQQRSSNTGIDQHSELQLLALT
jgi:hypothetical protein